MKEIGVGARCKKLVGKQLDRRSSSEYYPAEGTSPEENGTWKDNIIYTMIQEGLG